MQNVWESRGRDPGKLHIGQRFVGSLIDDQGVWIRSTLQLWMLEGV